MSGAAPAVSDGRVYAGSEGGVLYTFDRTTGEIQWQRSFGSELRSGISVREDTVHVATRDGRLVGVQAETGQDQWDTQLRGQVFATAAVTDETIYQPTTRQLVALDRSTRTTAWQASPGAIAAPVVLENGVYVGGTDGTLRVYDRTTGTVQREFDTGEEQIRSSLAVERGTVYVGGSDGVVYALGNGA